MWLDSATGSLNVYYAASSSWIGFTGNISSTSPVYSVINTSITAIAASKYIVDTTNNVVTITLPTVAILGDEISIIDASGTSNTNNITIARNAHKIQGLAEDMVVAMSRAAFTLVYYNNTQGWVLTQV